jgi:hypothetical protein
MAGAERRIDPFEQHRTAARERVRPARTAFTRAWSSGDDLRGLLARP